MYTMKNFIKGIIYGVFSICPGLSGGILAIRFGDYNKIISIFTKKDFNLNNIRYLFIIFTGFILGTILFSNIIIYLYKSYETMFNIIVLFISIYLLTSIIINSNIKILQLILITLFSLLFMYITKDVSIIHLDTSLLFLISGFIFSFSKIIPGISGTSILINIGFYKHLLTFFSNPLSMFSDFFNWLLFWISFILSGILIIKYICAKEEFLNYLVVFVMLVNVFLMLIK